VLVKHGGMAPEILRYAIPAVIILAVLAFRLRSMSRERPLKIERLWIIPALYLVIAGLTFARVPPHGLGWLYCLLGLGAGVALGWQRGKMMRITVDPATHEIFQRASPAAMLFILCLILVRTAARNADSLGGGMIHVDVLVVTDVLIAFALGLLTTQRIEMYLRARRLLGEARAGTVAA
jgi:hypothetical protein